MGLVVHAGPGFLSAVWVKSKIFERKTLYHLEAMIQIIKIRSLYDCWTSKKLLPHLPLMPLVEILYQLCQSLCECARLGFPKSLCQDEMLLCMLMRVENHFIKLLVVHSGLGLFCLLPSLTQKLDHVKNLRLENSK